MKTKTKASVWECVMSECPNCGETVLIRTTVRVGDEYECGACGKRAEITAVTADYQPGNEKRIHESEMV